MFDNSHKVIVGSCCFPFVDKQTVIVAAVAASRPLAFVTTIRTFIIIINSYSEYFPVTKVLVGMLDHLVSNMD